MMHPIIVSLISGLSIGLLGSFHCIGMCGPLALSLPTQQFSKTHRLMAILNYNFGRALAYALLGVLFGVFGMGFSIFKMQQVLSITAGVLLLAIIIGIKFNSMNFKFFQKIFTHIYNTINNFLQKLQASSQFFSIGFANGFLPCGLVYVAIIAGITTGSMVQSGILLFGFGLGTIPLMMATMLLGKFISVSIRQKINKLTPYLMACIAVLLILRGLSLNIPFVSPKMVEEKVSCCHK